MTLPVPSDDFASSPDTAAKVSVVLCGSVFVKIHASSTEYNTVYPGRSATISG